MCKSDKLLSYKPCYYWDAAHASPSMDPSVVFNVEGNGNGAGHQIRDHSKLSTRQAVRPPGALSPGELKELLRKFPNHRNVNPNFMDMINFPRDASEKERSSSSLSP